MKTTDEEERRALAAWRGWEIAALVIALVALAGAAAHFAAGCQGPAAAALRGPRTGA